MKGEIERDALVRFAFGLGVLVGASVTAYAAAAWLRLV